MARTLAQKTATARNNAKRRILGLSANLKSLISQSKNLPKMLSQPEVYELKEIKIALDKVAELWKPTL